MKKQLIMWGIQILYSVLTPDLLAGLWKSVVAYIKEKVEGTDTKIDDYIFNAIMGGGGELNGILAVGCEFIEQKVLGSASKVDDVLVLPALNLFRAAFNIPDLE